MVIFILTNEPYHDNSLIIGAYSTLEEAKKASGLFDWKEESTWPNAVAQSGWDFDLYMIYSFRVDT